MIQYQPKFIPNKFVVIGAGGTGSRLVPLLSQFIKTANWIQNPELFIVDYDVVEDKNLVRQNFIKLDLNKPKCTVLANRYGKAFDLNIIPIVDKVTFLSSGTTSRNHLALSKPSNLFLSNLSNAIVIMCVDSVEARINILSHLRTAVNVLVIDSGNEDDFGQVVVYHTGQFKSSYYDKTSVLKMGLEGGMLPFDAQLPLIPVPHQFYANMVDTKGADCAMLDQTLAINAMMATSIMGIIQSFIYSKPLVYHKLNISLLHGCTPEYITLRYLADNLFTKNELEAKQKLKPFILFDIDMFLEKVVGEMNLFNKKMAIKSTPPAAPATKKIAKESA